jgi:hypothetical protein
MRLPQFQERERLTRRKSPVEPPLGQVNVLFKKIRGFHKIAFCDFADTPEMREAKIQDMIER